MEEAPVMRLVVWRALFVAGFLAGIAGAQRHSDDAPPNAPRNCPYCFGKVELMAAGDLVSHGPFPFGKTDTNGIDDLLPTLEILWLETAHFRIGLALSPYRPKQDEREKIRAELTELATIYEEINPKTKVIDPWLRLHLYGARLEKTWKRWLEIMQVDESDFPPPGKKWIFGTVYMGEGPFMGQPDKYEVLVLPTPQHQIAFLRDQFGLSHPVTQRWNVLERGALTVTTNLVENGLRDDQALHCHLAFNTAINLLDGYKFYAYDTPRWITEGLGHYIEREINPRFNSFDASEGSAGINKVDDDWDGSVRKLVLGSDAPRLAELVALNSFAEFTLRDHYACWSMTAFMIETNPDGYACLNANLHGIKGPDGTGDGSKIREKHREALKECFGMTYPEFDEAWRAWAASQ